MSDSDSSGAIAIVVSVVYLIVVVGLYVWTALALSRVFVKLGQPAWKGWVPVVNNYTLLELGGRNGAWVIALFFPIVGIVGGIMLILATIAVNRRFGRSDAFAVLGVLVFPVWASILGFGAAQPLGAADAAAFDRRMGELQTPSLPPQHGSYPSAPPVPSGVPLGGPAPSVAPPPPPPAAVLAPSPTPAAPPAAPPLPASAPSVAPPPPVSAAPAAPVVDPWAPPLAGAPRAVPAAAPVLPPVTPIAAPPASTAAVADLDARTILTGPSPTPADADADRTVISSSRSRQRWVLTPAGGQAVALSGASAILGRNPTPLDGAQRVVLEDATKTVSKTHARLDLRDGVWTITDLDSTNGVAVTDASGEQLELDSGASAAILAEFHLGELSLRLEVGGS